MQDHERHEVAAASFLSGLAGFVDAIGFLYLGGFFVSFMSGNTTRAGVALAQGELHQVFLAGGLVGSFVVGVMAGTVVGHLARERRRWVLMSLVCGLLTIAAALHLHPATVFIAPPLMAFAMGVENAVFERRGEVSIGLTYMTGTLVKMAQHIAYTLMGARDRPWLRYFVLWCGLGVGVLLGGLTYVAIGLSALWVAAAGALVATAAVWRLTPRV